MRLHRFFVEQNLPSEGTVVVTDEKVLHQWRNVLRLRAGNEVLLFDGLGADYRCEIVTLEKKEAICVIREVVKNEVTPLRELVLFPALIKKDHFEWLLEKVTELGVSEIQPIVSERTEVKKINIERARDIVKEATEQSGRGNLPRMYDEVSLQKALAERKDVHLIVFDRSGQSFRMGNFPTDQKLGAFIGPEGGWSQGELELLKKHNVSVYSLGTSTLRAETAGVAVTALLLVQS